MMRLLAALCLFGCAASVATAEDVYLTDAVTLESPRKKPPVIGDPSLETVEYSLWIPSEARPVRGLIFNPFSPSSKEPPVLKHWHEACRLWRFAYLTANYDGVNGKEFATTFVAALEEFAKRSERPELNHAPFCAIGTSRGGGYSRSFAKLLPERALAVAPVCLESPPDEPTLRGIPFITVFGEKDGGQMQKIMTAHPTHRGAGALWGVAVQWGRGHEFAKANNIAIPFFDAVIRRRLPESSPSGAPGELRDFPLSEAWLGDASGWSEKRRAGPVVAANEFRGEPSARVWLPDERTAHAWRAFVSGDKSVQIVEPPGLGDGQEFIAHPPKTPVKIRVVAKSPSPVKIGLYDGERLLEERDGLEAEFTASFEPGIHPVYALVHGADGVESFSMLHTLIVRERSESP